MELTTSHRLVNYGIQNEQSDIRAHVSMLANRVYVYETMQGRATVESGNYRVGSADTGGIVTGKGWLVPPRDIPGCVAVEVPEQYQGFILPSDSTSIKGNKAVEIVSYLLQQGLFPLKQKPIIVSEKDIQIQGTDITVNTQIRIQVKCDRKGGSMAHGGTGNLFLQFAECNPLKQY